jgi:hypothetical protein
MSTNCLWLEVSNVRIEGAEEVQVQLKGDRGEKEPTWWEVNAKAFGEDASATSREIFRALDSKRIVLAGIKAENNKLVVGCIRVQFNDSGSR